MFRPQSAIIRCYYLPELLIVIILIVHVIVYICVIYNHRRNIERNNKENRQQAYTMDFTCYRHNYEHK
jgi:glycerol-3-phosphate acyltransferase PlsY